MQKYSPARLVLNMPVNYIPISNLSSSNPVVQTGHFAFTDTDGYHYVFDGGGTSYTRLSQQVTKCYRVWPVLEKDQSQYRTEKMMNVPIRDMSVMRQNGELMNGLTVYCFKRHPEYSKESLRNLLTEYTTLEKVEEKLLKLLEDSLITNYSNIVNDISILNDYLDLETNEEMDSNYIISLCNKIHGLLLQRKENVVVDNLKVKFSKNKSIKDINNLARCISVLCTPEIYER